MDADVCILMDRITSAIKEAGYVPYDQLNAFIETNDERYITRHGNARTMIKGIDRCALIQYLDQMERQC